MKAVVAAFNQEKALVGAFSVITNLRMDLFEALLHSMHSARRLHDADIRLNRDPATTTSLSNTESQMDVQTQVKSLHYDW